MALPAKVLTPEELAQIELAWKDLYGDVEGERPDINDRDAIHLAAFRMVLRKWQDELTGLDAQDTLLFLNCIHATLGEIWMTFFRDEFHPWTEYIEWRYGVVEPRLKLRMMYGVDENGQEVLVG